MKKIIYSLLTTLMMMCAVECSAQTVSGNKDGHDYVDLGLPSGRLWATCNVGASKPTEDGEYFAWGETTQKDSCDIANYKFSKDSCKTFTKYVCSSNYGTVDRLTTLLAQDDAATANWGASWRMPTDTELIELLSGCDWEFKYDFNGSGVAGELGTSRVNGNTIFLPCAGYAIGKYIYNYGEDGLYWSSSLLESSSDGAFAHTYSDILLGGNIGQARFHALNVRAVAK